MTGLSCQKRITGPAENGPYSFGREGGKQGRGSCSFAQPVMVVSGAFKIPKNFFFFYKTNRRSTGTIQ